MHVQGLVRNVTSKAHTRSSSGSSKLTHSCASSGTPFLVAPIRAEAIGCRTVGVTTSLPRGMVEELRAALAADRVTVDALEPGPYGRDAPGAAAPAGPARVPPPPPA